MTQRHTIGSILKISEAWLAERGVDQPKIDAGTLLAKALGMKRLDLYLQTDRPLLEPELASFRPLLARRGRREPVSRIIGLKGFWNHDFLVTPAVLSPRADSELLVEKSLAAELPDEARVLDLCSGSGCIAISLAAERPDWTVVGSDVSVEALAVAQANGERCEVDVTWRQADGFAGLDGGFNLIVSNPPYVGERERPELDPEVANHDPALALFSGDDGLNFIRRLLDEAPSQLKAGGLLLIEHGWQQGEAVRALFAAKGCFNDVETHRDLGGRERVTAGRLNS